MFIMTNMFSMANNNSFSYETGSSADPDIFDFKLIVWVLLEFHYKTVSQK